MSAHEATIWIGDNEFFVWAYYQPRSTITPSRPSYYKMDWISGSDCDDDTEKAAWVLEAALAETKRRGYEPMEYRD